MQGVSSVSAGMKSPTLPGWALSTGGLALALVAGIMIGRTSSSKPGGDASSETADAAAGHGGAAGESPAGSDRSGRKKSAVVRSTPEKSISDLQGIMDATSRLDRTQKLLAFLDHLPTDQFADVYGSMRDMPGANLHGSERSLILQAWAERDPTSAVGFLQEKGANDWERETAVSTWASKDPQAAFSWALNAPDEGKVNNWQLGAARGIAATNPELARDYLMQMDGETRVRSLDAMQPYVMQYGFDYASNWIANVGDDALKSRAETGMARDLANLDPTKAAAWDATITDPKTRSEVSKTIADSWAATDINGAKAWVNSLPENTKIGAAEGVARQYAQQDPQQAAAWLTSLGNNPDLDGARRALVEESYGKSPQTSLDFVSNISDPKTREGYYWREINRWMKDDAASAQTWVNKNSNVLPPQIVQRLKR
jgi:hypothetical protein